MNPLERFCANSPPKRRVSRLKKFETEILKMYQDGYQVEQIQQFLATRKIKVSVRAINKFKQNKPSSSEAAQKSKTTQKTVEELKNSPDTNIATKLFLQNL